MQNKINKKEFFKYIGINYSIIIGITLLFSYFFSISNIFNNDLGLLFILNSISVLGILNVLLYPVSNLILLNIFLIIFNYIFLYFLYFLSFKYKKYNIGYIITIIYLLIALLIGFFYQSAYFIT